MSPAPLLALLGVTFLLPCVQALDCQWGVLESVWNVSELPIQWTNGQQTCRIGEGCQDTLMLIENGPQVNMVLTKGCTLGKDQEVQVTEHRTGPGLSVISYTHVCRHKDFCNDLSTTNPLWSMPTAKVPGTVRCPVCFSRQDCPEQICPEGHTHCYNGVLKFRGGGIASNLRVQGCMPTPGCDLLNGTQKIGPVDVSENCNPKSDTLTCYRGVMLQMGRGLAQEPVEWIPIRNQMCNAGKPPGVLVASYARFCSSDLCNTVSSSSVLLTSLPKSAAPALGGLQCPVCVELSGSCSGSSDFVTCPKGTTHCYNGNIHLSGGGVSTPVSIQGCMAPASRSLLNHDPTIGIFSVLENFEDNKDYNPEFFSPNGVAQATHLLWVVGLGLSLALWCEGLCPPY